MKIFSEYETARSIAAIETVSRLGKPVAEVGDRKYNPDEVEDLERDIQKCLSLAGESGVKGYLHFYGPERISYGFYSHDWVLSALGFLADTPLPDYHKDWISGLLFGYAPESIDSYLATNGTSDERVSNTSPCGDADTAGTSHPDSGRSHNRSPSTDRFQIVYSSVRSNS